MIEDALKSARTLHRLMMTVSLITLVFSLSLDFPRDKVAQKATIDALIAADFLAYEIFVEELVQQTSKEFLDPLEKAINDQLEGGGHQVFHLNHIGEKFATPIHIGKILTKDLVLSDISSATLVQLDALNGLNIGQDIQVLVPQTDNLINEINKFLSAQGSTGRRVDSIRVGITEFDFIGESFLPGEEAIGELYFELVDKVLTGGAPVFSAFFSADIRRIPNSSFLYWLESKSQLGHVVATKDGEITFAPTIGKTPDGIRAEMLGPLARDLANEIAASGPEEQSASILGATVPGLLIVFASPLTLFFLAYYFMNHTDHLRSLVKDDPKSFRRFAWLPLTLRRSWRIPGGNHRCVPTWILETAGSTVVLPIVSLAVLYGQLSQFGGIGFWPSVVIVTGAFGVLGFGVLSLRQISQVRSSTYGMSGTRTNR